MTHLLLIISNSDFYFKVLHKILVKIDRKKKSGIGDKKHIFRTLKNCKKHEYNLGKSFDKWLPSPMKLFLF